MVSVRIVATTDIPGRNFPASRLSRPIRSLTGIRCTTLVKLPVALSGGKRLNCAPLAGAMLSTTAVTRTPGKVYLTGGATALLLGFRDQTIDIDIKLDPEPEGVFEAIARLKDRLDINVELASPDDFIPPAAGWREYSRHVASIGRLEFFHYDFALQALAKVERGHAQDLGDAQARAI